MKELSSFSGEAAGNAPANQTAFHTPVKSTPSLKSSAGKSVLPPAFQSAPQEEEVESVPALKSALAMGRVPLAEMMLDAEKLEAALKAIIRKKKMTGRRLSAGRFGKTMAVA